MKLREVLERAAGGASEKPCGHCDANDGRSMRILNRNLAPSVPTIPAAEPDVRFFKIHGERLVFDANSLCLVHVGERLFADLKALNGETADDGPQTADKAVGGQPSAVGRHAFRGLLFSAEKPQFRLARATPVRRLVLNVTHGCNLACKYCFAGGHHDEPTMSLDTAMRGVALMDPRATLDIAFFGGEPLLAWDLVRRVMDEASRLAKRRGVKAKFHITTNGTLLDEEKIAFLRSRPCSLLVSLDGPKDIHDAARPFRCGTAARACPAEGGGCESGVAQPPAPVPPKAGAVNQSSFDAVMNVLQTAAKLGMSKRIMARATFFPRDARLVERLEFFAETEDAGLIGGYSVEPAVLGEGCARRGDESFDRAALAAEYHAAAAWFVDRVRRKRRVGFFHFRKLLERIVLAKHAGSECGAGNGYVTVAPDGTIHACHREGTAIGHVDYGIDEERRAAWTDNRLYKRPGCMRCWARYLCGGGCRQARLELGGDLDAPVPGRCFIQRTLLRECFWMLTQLRRHEIERVVRT